MKEQISEVHIAPDLRGILDRAHGSVRYSLGNNLDVPFGNAQLREELFFRIETRMLRTSRRIVYGSGRAT